MYLGRFTTCSSHSTSSIPRTSVLSNLGSTFYLFRDGLPRHTRRSLFGRNHRMGNPIPQVMSPRLPAFTNPPGFALAQAIPELEASFALVTDRIHYQSGQEELTAQRVTENFFCATSLWNSTLPTTCLSRLKMSCRHGRLNKGSSMKLASGPLDMRCISTLPNRAESGSLVSSLL